MKTKANVILICAVLAVYWVGLFNANAFYNPGTQRWVNRDPIQEQGGLNLFAYEENDAISSYDALGLDTTVKSGPGIVSGGIGTVLRHHPFFFIHRKSPPVIDAFTLTCPSSEPYLISYGLTGTYSPPFDNFPNGWGGILSGRSPTYTISVEVPSRITLFGLQDELTGLYVQGICSCKSVNPIPRNDPSAPPPWPPNSVPFYPYPGAGPL